MEDGGHLGQVWQFELNIVTMPLQGGYGDNICNNIIFSIFNGLILFIFNPYLGNLHRGGDHSHIGSHWECAASMSEFFRPKYRRLV